MLSGIIIAEIMVKCTAALLPVSEKIICKLIIITVPNKSQAAFNVKENFVFLPKMQILQLILFSFSTMVLSFNCVNC